AFDLQAAEREVVLVARQQVVAANLLLVDVDVGRVDFGDRVGRHARVGRIALEHVTERVRIDVCCVAAAEDGVRIESGNLVVNLDLEVVQGNAQRRERRGPHDAGGEGIGRFRLQEAGAATAEHLRRGRTAGEVGGDAGRAAV